MADAVRNASNLLGGIGSTDPGDAPDISVTLESPASGSMLRDFMARRNGEQQEAQAQPDKHGREIEDLKTTWGQRLEALEAQNQHYKDTIDRQFKLMEGIATRPVNVAAPAPPQQYQEQLPSVQLDDPELIAAFNTLDQRVVQRIQHVDKAFNARLEAQAKAQTEREFNFALKKIKADPARSPYFDEAKVRQDARGLLENPAVFNNPNMDWERELELAYMVNSTPAKDKELEELRAYKKQTEAKLERQRAQQKSNLNQVPALGGRGGSTSGGSGLLADSILSDAKKAGKRLSWGQFGNEFKRRRSG